MSAWLLRLAGWLRRTLRWRAAAAGTRIELGGVTPVPQLHPDDESPLLTTALPPAAPGYPALPAVTTNRTVLTPDPDLAPTVSPLRPLDATPPVEPLRPPAAVASPLGDGSPALRPPLSEHDTVPPRERTEDNPQSLAATEESRPAVTRRREVPSTNTSRPDDTAKAVAPQETVPAGRESAGRQRARSEEDSQQSKSPRWALDDDDAHQSTGRQWARSEDGTQQGPGRQWARDHDGTQQDPGRQWARDDEHTRQSDRPARARAGGETGHEDRQRRTTGNTTPTVMPTRARAAAQETNRAIENMMPQPMRAAATAGLEAPDTAHGLWPALHGPKAAHVVPGNWPELLDDAHVWSSSQPRADLSRVARLEAEQKGRPWNA